MQPQELQNLLNERSFQPHRLHLSSGHTVDIRHPQLAIVSRSLVSIACGQGSRAHAEPEPGEIVNHIAHYNLLHVVKIEPINRQNGQLRKGRKPRGK